jgi:hypothetical protein
VVSSSFSGVHADEGLGVAARGRTGRVVAAQEVAEERRVVMAVGIGRIPRGRLQVRWIERHARGVRRQVFERDVARGLVRQERAGNQLPQGRVELHLVPVHQQRQEGAREHLGERPERIQGVRGGQGLLPPEGPDVVFTPMGHAHAQGGRGICAQVAPGSGLDGGGGHVGQYPIRFWGAEWISGGVPFIRRLRHPPGHTGLSALAEVPRFGAGERDVVSGQETPTRPR